MPLGLTRLHPPVQTRQWSIDGKALSGPLVGNSLPKIPEAYVSFWFAFSQFYPNLHLWLP